MFGRVLTRFIQVAASMFYKIFVTDVADAMIMTVFKENSQQFKPCTYEHYATDVMFQEANGACGIRIEARPYYSAKTWHHGFRTETSVLRNGICILSLRQTKWGKADISIFCWQLAKKKNVTEKFEDELDLSDVGEITQSHLASLENEWYRGLQSDTHVVVSKKNPALVNLTYQEKEQIEKLERSRRRRNVLWKSNIPMRIISNRFKWNKECTILFISSAPF